MQNQTDELINKLTRLNNINKIKERLEIIDKKLTRINNIKRQIKNQFTEPEPEDNITTNVVIGLFGIVGGFLVTQLMKT